MNWKISSYLLQTRIVEKKIIWLQDAGEKVP